MRSDVNMRTRGIYAWATHSLFSVIITYSGQNLPRQPSLHYAKIPSCQQVMCPSGNFHAFLSSADFFKKFFQEYHMSNSLDPAQARHFVGPHLGPTCLQRLPSDGTRRQRVKLYQSLMQILW